MAGFLIIGAGWLAWTAAQRGASLRTPDDGETAAIADPLARILCRHFPMAGIGPDLTDGLESVVAVNKYAKRGPLLMSAAAAPTEGTN